MEIFYSFSQEELDRLQYPVLVEGWDRIGGVRAGGKQRKAYRKEFTPDERRTIQRYYTIFYHWYLITGTPEHYRFRKLKTVDLLQRAINFFATH